MKLIGAIEGRESQKTNKHSESKRPSLKDDFTAELDKIGAGYLSLPKKPAQGKTNNNPRD